MPKINPPLSVPRNKSFEYAQNYRLAAPQGHLFLIAGDQKIEHLNQDFYGRGISPEDNNPEHLFKIAAQTKHGVLATHLGLISRYGQSYKKIPYIVKINGKTNLGVNEDKDSSKIWWKPEIISDFKKQSGLKIVGIGYTLYLGGKYEAKMLAKAAKAIYEAHQQGLLAIIWIYPRGKNVKEESPEILAGAAGVAACLDADFAKIKYPYGLKDKDAAAKQFRIAVQAAGRTKIICVGGDKKSQADIVSTLKRQLEISGSSGLAIGRNMHQRSLKDAAELSRAIESVLFPKIKSRQGFLGLF